jgi:hypothetical protein
MPLQTTYGDRLAIGYAGMIANTEPHRVISRHVETAALGFGVPVIQGTADLGVVAVSASTDQVLGFTVRDQATKEDEYAVNDEANLLVEGVMFVTVTDAGGVSAGDAVWVSVANGTLSNADLGSDGSLRLPGCRWETSGANGELAKIRVNLNQPAVPGA